jgi:antitoxin component HigA of HigAB toxin-antitoxin module
LTIKPILTDADNDEALREIGRLWHAEKGTPDLDRLEALVTLVCEYEETHCPMTESGRDQ